MLRAMQPARLPDSHLGSVAQVDTPVVDMVILVFNVLHEARKLFELHPLVVNVVNRTLYLD